ncbi:hypothetical protein DH2020_020987 [Rehmannia glutinosa]|uniref:Uncharacterized protein n=1 Tax=Rehmannia glutinosa TaxID=99300 RepID=A0ABR0W934_REHGL
MDTSEKRPLSPPSSFDDEAKGQKLSPRKVCMISVLPMSPEFHIYIVDLNSRELNSRANTDDGLIPLSPSIRLDWENDGTAFCVIDSTLYMFECKQKSVFFIDLSSSESYSGAKLDKSKLPRAGDMEHTKRTPYAIPTPDGKILLFSNVIPFVRGSTDKTGDERVDFELYDPSAKSWQKLPGLFLHGSYRQNDFWITGLNFINKSTVFLVSSNSEMFALDLNSLDKGWDRRDSFYGAGYVPGNCSRFFVIEEEMCLAPNHAYDTKTGKGWFEYPPPSADATTVFFPNQVTPLDGDNGEYNFCNVLSTPNSLQEALIEGNYTRMMITLYNCDLNKYRAEKQEIGDRASPTIDIVKSFKFLLDDKEFCCFIPLYLFPIGAGTDYICPSMLNQNSGGRSNHMHLDTYGHLKDLLKKREITCLCIGLPSYWFPQGIDQRMEDKSVTKESQYRYSKGCKELGLARVCDTY